MCGIVGIGGPRGGDLLGRLTADLVHRGPDSEGGWRGDELALGHCRLAIIGLDSGGDQPMWSRSGESVIVFNGEIYNYLEIADRLEAAGRPVDRRYDTAVLLEALECWGTEALPGLNGMFAFAWYRPASRRLVLARDRYGKKPLFWGRVGLDGGERSLVFSSELRTFRDLPGGPPPRDPLGVARYLVYDGMPDTRTVYQGVFKVAAGSWIELDTGGEVRAEKTFWEFQPAPRPIGEAEATERLLHLLRQSFRLRLRSDVPVGLFLSGGIDSSLLAAIWRDVAPDTPIRTFTVGFDDPSYDERASARRVADFIGAEHHEILVTGRDLEDELDAVWDHLSEPFADPSIIPMSMLCRFARREVKVAFGGDGGDELQAGYDPFRAWWTARAMEHVLPRRLWYRTLRGVEKVLPVRSENMALRFKARHFAQGFLHPPAERIQGWMASFAVPDALRVLNPDIARQVDPDEVLEPTRRAYESAREHGELFAQIHAWIRTYLECSILAKVDRASMMHSLEVRAPFLDPDLGMFLASLPPRWIYRRGEGKRLLRAAARRKLPPDLLRKSKKGLGVPQSEWLRTILKDRMTQCLEETRRDGWFDHRAMERLWQAHLSGRDDLRKPLWNFLFSFPFQKR